LFYFFTKNLLREQIFCEKDGPFPVFLGNMWLEEPHVSQKGYFFRPAGGEKNSLMEDRVTRVNEVRRCSLALKKCLKVCYNTLYEHLHNTAVCGAGWIVSEDPSTVG
jgi:hypothetical protein